MTRSIRAGGALVALAAVVVFGFFSREAGVDVVSAEASPSAALRATSLAFGRDGALFVGYDDGVLDRVRISPLSRTCRMTTRSSAIKAITTSPDGQRVATVSGGGVLIRDAHTLATLASLPAGDVAFRADGRVVLARQQKVVLYDLHAGTAERFGGLALPQGKLIGLSPDGAIACTVDGAGESASATAWGLGTSMARRLSCIRSEGWNGFGVVMVTARFLVSLDYPHNPLPELYPHVYDLRTGRRVLDLAPGSAMNDTRAAMDSLDRMLIVAGDYPTDEWVLYAYALRAGGAGWGVSTLSAHPAHQDPPTGEKLASISTLAVSPNGKWVVIAGQNGICVLDGKTGALLSKYRP